MASSIAEEGQPIKFIKIWGGGYQKAGIPDLICCINGIYFEVELGSSTGRPTELQKHNIKLTNAANGIGIIFTLKDLNNSSHSERGDKLQFSHSKLDALKAAQIQIQMRYIDKIKNLPIN